MTNTWAEARYLKIRDLVYAQRRDARFSVEYNGEQAMRIEKKIRWTSVLASITAVLTAALLLWIPKVEAMAIVLAGLSIVSPLVGAFVWGLKWRERLAGFQKAQDWAGFLELRFDGLFCRLETRPQNLDLDTIEHEMENLKQCWQIVSAAEPQDPRDAALVNICEARANDAYESEDDDKNSTEEAEQAV